MNQVIERLERRDHATGRHIDIGAKGTNTVMRVTFRIGVNGDVALVEVSDHALGQRAGRRRAHPFSAVDRLLGNENGHTGTLRFVILARHIQDIRPDNGGYISQNLRQPLGIVSLIDVGDVFLALAFGSRVAQVIDIEAERLGQIIETVELDAA